MATFLRVAARQSRRLLLANTTLKTRVLQPSCMISTSKKNKDAATVNEAVAQNTKAEENLLDKEENWMSFGYSLTDRDYDEWSHKMILFIGITLCFGIGGLYIAYFPDFKMRDWAQREAYLELARREKAGEPLISPNLIPEDKMTLPSDEELGDTEIII